MFDPLPRPSPPRTPHDAAGDHPPAVLPAVPAEVHSTVQSFVAEYAGAVAPGRVVALAMATAVAERRSRPGVRPFGSADSLEHWRTRTRRRLTEEVVSGLLRSGDDGPAGAWTGDGRRRTADG